MAMEKKLEQQSPQPLNRRGIHIWIALLGPFMTSKDFTRSLCSHSLQEQWSEQKVFVWWEHGQVKALSRCSRGYRTLQKLPVTQPTANLHWMLKIRSWNPIQLEEQWIYSYRHGTWHTSKEASPLRLLNQLCSVDLFFHCVSTCTPITLKDSWKLTLISVNPGKFYSCLVSKTGKLHCSILYIFTSSQEILRVTKP